jgi:hypothetical protein
MATLASIPTTLTTGAIRVDDRRSENCRIDPQGFSIRRLRKITTPLGIAECGPTVDIDGSLPVVLECCSVLASSLSGQCDRLEAALREAMVDWRFYPGVLRLQVMRRVQYVMGVRMLSEFRFVRRSLLRQSQACVRCRFATDLSQERVRTLNGYAGIP